MSSASVPSAMGVATAIDTSVSVIAQCCDSLFVSVTVIVPSAKLAVVAAAVAELKSV